MDEQDNNRVYIRKTKPSFTREQRAGFVLVIGAGAIAALLGLVYVGRHLTDPFAIDYSGPMYLTSDEQEWLDLLEQQNSDTDKDTLSDYDELYVYKTSPYLQDTDGDGYNDATEIATSSDPTCAAGADCNTADDIAVGTTLDFGISDVDDTSVSNTDTTISQIESAISNLSVTEIRQLLIDSGADETLVSTLTDEEVKTLFDAVIADLTSTGQLDSLIETSLQ
ncbi:hypothetical protein CO057_00575 [Candidatus Uhrbacteria bacterium CG_4_9_14_0_2_um_filter_41_50]|uniref:Uncharacterized protein n=1 Tax=Candidatus Uhrbacteria bacterium CG_4_9_14_0_2_um_filter_41_50 TaxID=1975031 RepID=A0A2M8EQ56_9BACT|nr:MAG: hypothetical protein COZ45_01025 [Candidatus Uhrbacteria bacterium CG_4_10_14_3_um_filter_41_21]PIZ54438.1 MAG: hypothetical protein COY24_03735 [Candidatus Uhrbacteria bacterium CG_4_10_14_0_2_um_filter_41_21]PJB84825.1 MAG: hypothetical protein CO086_01545 [Candidatus Uhrbacteria bacterium CG_4_9_14_0_8_um_filter_41_16]PJC24870.1 MAG: hypothetical protein CO057_00575 [Candidatus Uhrbacteria bacterium CG_4_9_14_0_2_um_filter_41_50]PJE74847.1 MAG: hypothetical protein COV03_03310 [Candi